MNTRTQKSNALRLADCLEGNATTPWTREEVAAELRRIAELEAQLSELRKDTARLDWMDAQVNNHPVYNGYSWQEAGYENDRGLVCKIQTKKERTSVRKAIDIAMQKD